MGEFLRLRHRLMPYLYTMNYRASESAEPMIMPMYYKHPESAEAYEASHLCAEDSEDQRGKGVRMDSGRDLYRFLQPYGV